MQQVDPRPRQMRSSLAQLCRRCRRTHLAEPVNGSDVCVGCRAQEVVARHVPPAQCWLTAR
jgi:hypothetical protein